MALAVGWNWTLFDGTAPAFAVLEPLDHEPWLSHVQYFGEVRYYVSDPGARVRPYLGGRVGWARDFLEYAGLALRSGALIGVEPGVKRTLRGRLYLDASFLVTTTRLGDAVVHGTSLPASSSSAGIRAVRIGLGIDF